MKIIRGAKHHTSKSTLPTLFFQGSFSSFETFIMLVSFLILCIVLLIVSILSPPIITQENYFYPFSSYNKTSKTFNFLFENFLFLHRSIQLDCEFVRHHEGPLPQLKLGNHVTESIFIGEDPELLVENYSELEYDQEIFFNQNDRKSNIHSFFLEQQKKNHFINLSLVYDSNFTEIAGFNFFFSYGNHNVQLFLSISKYLLFLLTCILIFSITKNTDIKNTKFYRLIIILEILSCLSLNPLYDTFGFTILNFIAPLYFV